MCPYSDQVLADEPRADKTIKIAHYDKRQSETFIFNISDLAKALNLKKTRLYEVWKGVKKDELEGPLETGKGFYHISPRAAEVLCPSQFELYDYLCRECNRFRNGCRFFRLGAIAKILKRPWLTITRELQKLVEVGLIKIVNRGRLGELVIQILPFLKEKLASPEQKVVIEQEKPKTSNVKIEPKTAAGPPKDEAFFDQQSEEERASILYRLAKAISDI